MLIKSRHVIASSNSRVERAATAGNRKSFMDHECTVPARKKDEFLLLISLPLLLPFFPLQISP